MSRIVTFVMLLGILLLVGILFYRVISGFLLPLFLAALLAVIFRPLYLWLLPKCKNRAHAAAALTTVAILLVVLSPLATVISLAIHEANQLRLRSRGDLMGQITSQIETLTARLGLERPFAEELARIEQRLVYLQSAPAEAARNPVELAPLWRAGRDLNEDVTALVKQFSDLAEFLNALEKAGYGWQGFLEFRAIADRIGVVPPQPLLDGSWKESELRAAARLIDEQDKGMPEELAELQENVTRLRELLEARAAELGWDESEPAAAKSTEQFIVRGPLEFYTQYQQRLDLAVLSLKNLRTQLHGGPLRAWLVDLANPTETRIQAMQTRAQHWIREWLPGLTGQATALVGNVLIGLVIMIVSLFYFFVDGPSMVHTVMRLSPLADEYEHQMLREFDAISRAVVVATLLSAIVQGLLAGIGYFLVGVDSVFLLTMLTMVLALVPFVGAAAVWVPVGLWLLLVQQRFGAGIFLLIYGMVVVSMSDNVIKPIVLHGRSRLHPLLALLSVLGGVKALGPIGILVGPMVVSFLQAVMTMLNRELDRMGSE